mgnify:CR=1 FL=1
MNEYDSNRILDLIKKINYLKTENIKHQVLNAKNHENEAEIIANAGKEGSVIITTSILSVLPVCYAKFHMK